MGDIDVVEPWPRTEPEEVDHSRETSDSESTGEPSACRISADARGDLRGQKRNQTQSSVPNDHKERPSEGKESCEKEEAPKDNPEQQTT
jgi:hypothetical protein